MNERTAMTQADLDLLDLEFRRLRTRYNHLRATQLAYYQSLIGNFLAIRNQLTISENWLNKLQIKILFNKEISAEALIEFKDNLKQLDKQLTYIELKHQAIAHTNSRLEAFEQAVRD